MQSKAIRVDTELIEQLRKLRSTSETYPNKNTRPSFSAVIRKLIHDSQELRKVEQFAMSGNDSTPAVRKLNLTHPEQSQNASKKTYKKSSNSIHLFCFACRTQLPHRQLISGEWKCSICGANRPI